MRALHFYVVVLCGGTFSVASPSSPLAGSGQILLEPVTPLFGGREFAFWRLRVNQGCNV